MKATICLQTAWLHPLGLRGARLHAAWLPAAFGLILLLLPVAAQADLGGFEIARFETELTVRSNAELLVAEEIDVDFSEARHGIYRTIPVRYTDPLGYVYSLDLRVESVLDASGRKHEYAVEHAGRYVKIRIGDPDRMVEGRVHYSLRYRVNSAVGHFAQHDELYWNATGNEWNANIREASAIVRLPALLPADSLQVEAFTGRFGSKERNASIEIPEPGIVRVQTNRRLTSLEGLTIAVAWPRGHVTFPSAGQRFASLLADNWIILAPIAVFLWLWMRYRRRGRDPEGPAAVMVRYEPPEGVSAGELGALVDETVDLRDITATLVDLAVRGYIVIRVEARESMLGLARRNETIFERTDKDASDLLEHEARLYRALFDSGDVVDTSDLKAKFYVHLPGIRDAIYDRLVANKHFEAHPGTVRQRYVGLGILTALVVVGIGLLWAKSRGLIFPNALTVPILSGLVSAVLFLLFARSMPRRTESGVRLRHWALGFEEFVDRVEGEQLEHDRARNVFETLLPYALALGIASRWAKRFEGLYDQPPAWFQGGTPGPFFSTSAFHSTLAGALDRAGTTMTSMPRSQGSSGFGGGGFSGGGGGGGGGGSW